MEQAMSREVTVRVYNLEPDSGDDLFVKDLPLGMRPGACHPWDADKQILANLQVSA